MDITRVKEYRDEAAKLTGEVFIAMMFHYLSNSRLVTIAQIDGHARGGERVRVRAVTCGSLHGSPRSSASLSRHSVKFQAEALSNIWCDSGRSRGLEVLLSAEDCDAELAQRYGWINRALPRAELDGLVSSLARRIASFRQPVAPPKE